MSKKFIQELTCGKVDCLHSAELAHSLHQQCLNGEYCDLKVVVEDRCYSVHKCVIASFSAKFCGEMEKSEMIRLLGVTKFGFEKTLEFMYKGKMARLASLDLPKFQEIMKAADVLNSSKVIRYCTQERSDLIQTLNRNCLLDVEKPHSSGGTAIQSSDSVGMKKRCVQTSEDLNQAMVTDTGKEDEDPLRGSSKSLVECLAAEGEVGKDLTTVFNNTLSAEDLTKLMEISSEAMSSTMCGVEKKRPSIFDGWQKKFQCSVCSKGFVSDALLQHHMEKHKEDQYSCHVCGNKYRFEIALLSHLKEHTQNKFVCKICDRGFKFGSSLKLHTEKCHPDEFAKAQTVVSKPVGNVMPLAKVREEEEEQAVDVSLLTEMLSQMQPNGEGKFVCPLCDRDFSRKWNLRYHILKHAEDRALWPKFDPKSGRMLHQCAECNSAFQKETGLRRHMSIMHRSNYISTTKPLAMLSGKRKKKEELGICCWCDVCGKGFKRQRNLRSHMATHNGSGFECPICGMTFPQKDSLNGHLWIHGGYNGANGNIAKRRKSCPPLSNHVPIEGQIIVHPDGEQIESMDLISHEKIPDNLSETAVEGTDVTTAN